MGQPEARVSELDDPAHVVASIVNQIAGTEVEAQMSFFDLGLDSIQLLDICNQINEQYGEVIDLFLLFENPTVSECVDIITAHRGGSAP